MVVSTKKGRVLCCRRACTALRQGNRSVPSQDTVAYGCARAALQTRGRLTRARLHFATCFGTCRRIGMRAGFTMRQQCIAAIHAKVWGGAWDGLGAWARDHGLSLEAP